LMTTMSHQSLNKSSLRYLDLSKALNSMNFVNPKCPG
jgi:hypothetical protein